MPVIQPKFFRNFKFCYAFYFNMSKNIIIPIVFRVCWLLQVKTLSELIVGATPESSTIYKLDDPALYMKIEIFPPMFYIYMKLVNNLFLTLVITALRKKGQNCRKLCVLRDLH